VERACTLSCIECSGRRHRYRSRNGHGCGLRRVDVVAAMCDEGRSFVLTLCAPEPSVSSFLTQVYALLAGGGLDETVCSFFGCSFFGCRAEMPA